MITDKDLHDRFERLPKWAQEELASRDRMIKSLTDELATARGEVANPFVWEQDHFYPRPLLGVEQPTMFKGVLIGSDPENAFHIGVYPNNMLRIMGRNLGEDLVIKPQATNVVEISSVEFG